MAMIGTSFRRRGLPRAPLLPSRRRARGRTRGAARRGRAHRPYTAVGPRPLTQPRGGRFDRDLRLPRQALPARRPRPAAGRPPGGAAV